MLNRYLIRKDNLKRMAACVTALLVCISMMFAAGTVYAQDAEESDYFITSHDNYSELSFGMHGYEVWDLQERLVELGYLYVDPDGWYGNYTQRAVKKFQMYNGLYVTGTADTYTLSRLFSYDAQPFYLLMKGCTGTAVYMLQDQLASLGYLSAAPDGGFGSLTDAALIRFQKSNGLYADGIFGPHTAEVLFDDPVFYSEDDYNTNYDLAMEMTRQVLNEIGWDLYTAFLYSVQLGEVFNGNLTDATTSEAVINGLYSPYVDCVRSASVFCYLARNLGYEAWVMSGEYLMTTGYYGIHSWCKIVVNGDVLICDPTRGVYGYMFHYGDPGTLRYNEYGVMADY